MKAPTREDFFRVGAAEVISRSSKRPPEQRISREAIFTEGTDVNFLLAGSAAMADEGMRHHAQAMAALYFDSAEGEDLDRVVADRTHRKCKRKQANASRVGLRFSRSVALGTALTFQPGRKFRADGVEFQLTAPVSFPAGFIGSVDGSAVAVRPGVRGNVDQGRINAFVVASEDANISVTNPEPASGGDEKEVDSAFRDRASRWFESQVRGTIQAIEYGATTVQGVRSAVLTELLDGSGNPTGFLTLAIADERGRANKLLVDAVNLELRNWRGAGVAVAVIGGVPRYEAVAYSLGFKAGVNSSDASEQVKILTVASVNTLAPGEALTRAQLLTIARSVYGVIVSDNSVTVPAGTIVPASAEVIRTNLSLVTVNGL